MTSPSGPSTVTTDPNVHTTPSGGSAAFDPSDMLKQFEQMGPAIIRMVLAEVLQAVAGISIFGVEPFAGLATWATDLEDQTNTSTSLIGSIASLFGLGSSSDLAGSPSSIWASAYTTFIQPLITGVSDLVGVVQGLFGVTPGADPSADLTELGSKLMSLLGDPNFNLGGSFDPIAAGQQQLQDVLTPAGGLSTFTQLPAHLLAEVGIGQASTNLLPAGGFDDPSVVSGTSGWTYDGTQGHTSNGSVWASGAGILRQMIGVAIGTNPGDVTQMSCWTKWTGVTATTGAAITLCANAYSDSAATSLISDANRVLAKITTPGTSSSGFAAVTADHASAADSNGWVQLSGSYQAPTGTMKVRLVLEVESVVNAGSVGFDDCVQTIQSGIFDASLLKNMENAPMTFLSTVEGFLDLPDQDASLQHLFDGLGNALDPTGGLSGLGYSDLFALMQNQATNASLGQALASAATAILGNRTNKSSGTGANSTSLSSMEIGHYSTAGAFTTTSVAAGQSLGQIFTVPEIATYGFTEILASIPSGTNHVYLNVYKIDPAANTKAALFNSADLSTTVGTSISAPNRVLMAGMPQSAAGDKLLFEIVNNSSSNALTVVSKNNVIGNNTNEVIQNIGWSRATSAGGVSPTSLTSGQGSYQATNAFANVGIISVPAGYHPPAKDDWTVAGSYSETMPSWLVNGSYLDVQGIGSGGAGGSSLFYATGQGGGSATWGTQRLVVGTGIKLGSTYSWVVGDRATHVTGQGGGSTPGVNGNGNPGNSTTFTYTDPGNATHTITFGGGQWGAVAGGNNSANSNGINGSAANSITVDGITYPGGASVAAGATGQSPGGGGGGAISYGEGGDSGVGQLSLYRSQ